MHKGDDSQAQRKQEEYQRAQKMIKENKRHNQREQWKPLTSLHVNARRVLQVAILVWYALGVYPHIEVFQPYRLSNLDVLPLYNNLSKSNSVSSFTKKPKTSSLFPEFDSSTASCSVAQPRPATLKDDDANRALLSAKEA